MSKHSSSQYVRARVRAHTRTHTHDMHTQHRSFDSVNIWAEARFLSVLQQTCSIDELALEGDDPRTNHINSVEERLAIVLDITFKILHLFDRSVRFVDAPTCQQIRLTTRVTRCLFPFLGWD